jgi:hypothetical protein
MADSFGGESGKSKADSVAMAVNRLLYNLILKCTKSEGVREYFEVGVIGYGTNVGNAFASPLSQRDLVSVKEIADYPIRMEERLQKVEDGAGGLVEKKERYPVWFMPTASNGTPMAEALQHATRILQTWISQHPQSYPPSVINITDGEANLDPRSAARDLTSLSTSDGDVLLFNCHISDKSAPPVLFPDSDAGLADSYARQLFEMSSVLPDKLRDAAAAEGIGVGKQSRGFVFHAHPIQLIQFLDIGTRYDNLR